MFSNMKKKILAITLTTIIVSAAIIGILVGNIFSATNNHYVVDVIKEEAKGGDSNLEIKEKIIKEGQYFDSKKLTYNVEMKNISQKSTIESQVAIVVDTSYSMETNDPNGLALSNAKETAMGIVNNVSKSRIAVYTNSKQILGMTNNTNSINTYMTAANMENGNGNDCNEGLELARNAFVNAQVKGDTINKYIILFTDATDNVSEKLKEIASSNPDINILTVLIDMTSNSYVVNSAPVVGQTYMIYDEVEAGTVDGINEYNAQTLYDNLNSNLSKITLANTFSKEVQDNFNIDESSFKATVKNSAGKEVTTSNSTINVNSTGYELIVDNLKFQETVILEFTIELRTNKTIDAGAIFKELCTNETQDITYTTTDGQTNTTQGTDSRTGTESTVIKISQGYDIKIHAVNESNTDLAVDGIDIEVIGKIKNDDGTTGETVCEITKTTDKDGNIEITADEVRALRLDGTVVFTLTPKVNKVGYNDTESVLFDITNDAISRNLSTYQYGNSEPVIASPDENRRLISITQKINSTKAAMEIRVQELNNENVTLAGCEFELIQPKLNNKYEMNVLTGKTDGTGTLYLSPTVMTLDGTYNYILRQVSTQDRYNLTPITLLTITYKDGKIVSDPKVQFNNDVTATLVADKDIDNHVLIVVGNENLAQDPFDLQIKVKDRSSGDGVANVTYLVTTNKDQANERRELVKSDSNGEIRTQLYGSGWLTLDIEEQIPAVGYKEDKTVKHISVERVNGVITTLVPTQTDYACGKNTDNTGLELEFTTEKKSEQNIIKLTLLDSAEEDVAVGSGVVYQLQDSTGAVLGADQTNRKGEIKFTIGTDYAGGPHRFTLAVDDATIPNEYDESTISPNVDFNLYFDDDGYLQSIGDNTVTEDNNISYEYNVENSNSEVNYIGSVTIKYTLKANNTVPFYMQLKDKDDERTPVKGATYNIDMEWENSNGEIRTKTITGRKTNSNGEITTQILKGKNIKVYVTETQAPAGYVTDNSTQEIYLDVLNNGSVNITSQSPYDLGQTNLTEPKQGARYNNNRIEYSHLNRKRTVEDTYVNISLNVIDAITESYVDGKVLGLTSTKLVDKDEQTLSSLNNGLGMIVSTGSNGSAGNVDIDYAGFLDGVCKEIIRAPGIGQDSEGVEYYLDINELQVTGYNSDSTPQYSVKPGTKIRLRLEFKYRDGATVLTKVAGTEGNRLIIKVSYSSGESDEKTRADEDNFGVYLGNILLDIKTNYDELGNLSLDFKKESKEGELLNGSKYTLKVTNPDFTTYKKEIQIDNNEDSSGIEITGINVNEGSIIELTEKEAPIGYAINESTETFEVTKISIDGEITLEQINNQYTPSRVKLKQKSTSQTSSGAVKNNYEITFIDYELDSFEITVNTIDKESGNGVGGYGFKITSSKNATKTLTTNSNGVGTAKVGSSSPDQIVEYTITSTQTGKYYKPIKDTIKLYVKFNEFGKVDEYTTNIDQSTQTDPNFNKLWKITSLTSEGNGKIAISINVEHEAPLTVKLVTVDKITGASVTDNVMYQITPSYDLEGIGVTSVDVGYVTESDTIIYTLSQRNVKSSYAKINDKKFVVTYNNAIIDSTKTYLALASNDVSLSVTGNTEITITVKVEPKIPFEIYNEYIFKDNNGEKVKVKDATYSIISKVTEQGTLGSGTETSSTKTDKEGMGAAYSDIFGTKEDEYAIFQIQQTNPGNVEKNNEVKTCATIDPFYVKLTYNADRSIKNAELVEKDGTPITNKSIKVSTLKNSAYSTYNNNNLGIVRIEIISYSEFTINIKNKDRRNDQIISGANYEVTSSYQQTDGTVVKGDSGKGTTEIKLNKARENTVVTYTIKETIPCPGYQSLGTDIQVSVKFDENKYVEYVTINNNGAIATASTRLNNIQEEEDYLAIDIEIKNNPLLKINITKEDSQVDNNGDRKKIKDVGFQIVGIRQDNNQTFSNSSKINMANTTGTPETVITDSNGQTTAYMDRTLEDKVAKYTITEVSKSSGYEWNDEDVVVTVIYDSNGKIKEASITQGETISHLTQYDSENFTIDMEVYNDEIKEFGIHVTATDAYDTSKKINDMKIEAWLSNTGTTDYTSDGEYELVGDNALVTGADRTGKLNDNGQNVLPDGKPDVAYGEDYLRIGKYTKGEGDRYLRLTIKNNTQKGNGNGNGSYYLDSEGNPIGYYKGNQHYNGYYQNVTYNYLIKIHFTDDGLIESAQLVTGQASTLGGWYADKQYVKVNAEGYLEDHTDYKLNVTLKFFPMLDLKVSAMDNYTYNAETKENGTPTALAGARFTVSTKRHPTGGWEGRDTFIEAGYIGYGNSCGYNDWVYGSQYEGTDEIFAPIEAPSGDKEYATRLYFVYEEIEPTNYQQNRPRYLVYYNSRLTAIIKVTTNRYGEIVYKESIERSTKSGDGQITQIKPYVAEGGSGFLTSNNNMQEYNYWYNHEDENRNINFYIGYGLTTTFNITAIDDISGTGLSNIRMTPFMKDTTINGVGVSNYFYEYTTIGYRDTNSNGQLKAKYWGAAMQSNVVTYWIGSSRQGSDYNGYLFPSDMASASIGGSGNYLDYIAKIDVTYDENGKISSVTSVGSDLWGDNNVAIDDQILIPTGKDVNGEKEYIKVGWDSQTGNIYIKMLYSRKFQTTLIKTDYYDSTTNNLTAAFDVISDKGLNTSIWSTTTGVNQNNLTPFGKVYKNTTVKYTLSETTVPYGYYPLQDKIEYYVTFDQNGNIGNNSVKSSNDNFEFKNCSKTTESVNKTAPDLTINIRNKPEFTLNVRIIDRFYKDDGLSDVYLSVKNSKGDIALGNPQTNSNGWANIEIGPVYAGETVTYDITQDTVVEGYLQNTTKVQLEVEFTDTGKIKSYSISNTSNTIVNNLSSTEFLNKRNVSLQIMNTPKDLKLALYKYDKTTNEPMDNVQFTVTKKNSTTGQVYSPTTITTDETGSAIATIDTFAATSNGALYTYTFHEDETPASYRKTEDTVVEVRYNPDGSINTWGYVANDNGNINTNTKFDAAINKSKYYQSKKVHFLLNVPNDNAFDLIIKDEDTNYSGLGIAGTKYNVSINGETYEPAETNEKGITRIDSINKSGTMKIQISENKAGEGYRDDITNTAIIDIEKGTQIYSLDLSDKQDGFIDDKNAQTNKFLVKVDEEYGTVSVTLYNETETLLTLVKQDNKTKETLSGVKFQIEAQQIDNSGNAVDDQVIVYTKDNNVTNEDGEIINTYNLTDDKGEIKLNLGVAPQNQIWKYTFKELETPEGYFVNPDLTMIIKYDQYGRIVEEYPDTTDNDNLGRIVGITEHENANCRDIYAIVYNVKPEKNDSGEGEEEKIKYPRYEVDVYTEDVDTNKRINGSGIKLTLTDENGSLIEVKPGSKASAKNDNESVTGNLGINGEMYTDADLKNPQKEKSVILEKGITYIDNILYEGTLNISVSQTSYADGYIPGGQLTQAEISLKVTYEMDPLGNVSLHFGEINSGGLIVSASEKTGKIRIIIKNESIVNFEIFTKEYSSDASENKPVPNVNYTITSEVYTVAASEATDLNETSQLSDAQGYIGTSNSNYFKAGRAKASKTIIYTLHQNTPTGYDAIDDIKVEVQYDTKGYINYYEILSSQDNCYIYDEGTSAEINKSAQSATNEGKSNQINLDTTVIGGRTISLVVQNKITINNYRVYVEAHAKDTDDDTQVWGQLIPGATYKITVHEAQTGNKISWTETTDANGLIKSPVFSATGNIAITLQLMDTPEGYQNGKLDYINIRRNIDTGKFDDTDDGTVYYALQEDVEIKDDNGNTTTVKKEIRDENGNIVLKLMPLVLQSQNKFTLVVNKHSTTTNDRITNNKATFEAEIYQKDEENNYTYIDNIGTLTTENNGKVIKDNINIPEENGVYILKLQEIIAPEGYKLLSEPIEIPITFKKNSITNNMGIGTIDIEGIEKVKATSIQSQILGLSVFNDEIVKDDEVRLTITKVDSETEEAIKNNKAIFKVTDNNGKYQFIETDDEGRLELDTIKVPTETEFHEQEELDNSNGITGNTLVTHVYKFTEVQAPTGYLLNGEEIKLSITYVKDSTTGEITIKEDENGTPEVTVIEGTDSITPIAINKPYKAIRFEIKNKAGQIVDNEDRGTYTINITKTDSKNGTTIKGATFEATLENGQKVTASTDENGNLQIKDIKIPANVVNNLGPYSYYIEETNAPEGYEKINGIAEMQVTFKPSSTQEGYYEIDKAIIGTTVYVSISNYDSNTIYISVTNDKKTEEPSEEKLYLKSTQYYIGKGNNSASAENYWSVGDTSEYKDGDLFIQGIRPQAGQRIYSNNHGTYLNEFLSNLETNADTKTVYIPIEMDAEGNRILDENSKLDENNDKTLIKTGMVVKLTKGKQEITLTIIVRGDLTDKSGIMGDGICGMWESNQIKTLNRNNLETNYSKVDQMAIDFYINKDNNYQVNKNALRKTYQNHNFDMISER